LTLRTEQVFDGASVDAVAFYHEQGFCHLRTRDAEFLKLIDECHGYYASNALNRNIAFRNAVGIPRHVIDVFRDRSSPALAIFTHPFVTAAIARLSSETECLVFTHAKISFKTPGAAVDWFPHQDNGYKARTDLRVGFAMFICLEDMDTRNGCLQLFPESHRLGTLPHERVIEDSNTGDNQLRIKSLPPHLRCLPITASRGDVLIFSCNMIHQSGSSTTPSKRLALIAEVEEYESRKLDDYGKAPIAAQGAYATADRLLMGVKSLVSSYVIWRILKRNRRLALFVRKLRY
jgi:ectoine hydroxylase-related dioxygenase (phytanoyl-CoA dioxygenase family)